MADANIELCEEDGQCYNGSPVLTPNGDGANDNFIISCLVNNNNTLYIYDRFGRTVYEQANYDNTWNGVNNQGDELPENGYMWVLELITDDGVREVYKGSLTIIRNSF